MNEIRYEDQNRLDELYLTLLEKRRTYLGYPNSALLDNTNLSRFLDLAINNVGDPFVGNNGMHTCELEREVLEFFREILHLDKEDFWGYVTNGGTESNTFGLYLARETFANGIVYYSEDSHYSIPKAVRLLNLKGVVIRSQSNGEMVIRKPPEWLSKKWQLATEKDIAHLILMPGVSREMIDLFVTDLAKSMRQR